MVDLMQIVSVIVNVYISFTEKKKRIYVATFLLNVAQLMMYFYNNDITTTLIYIVIVVRSLVYIYKDNIKNDLLPYLFIMIRIAIGFGTIENSLQILSILIPCYACYYLWFSENTQKLRVGNLIANVLWAIYNIYTGLYIVLIMRFITIASNGIALVKYELENKNKNKRVIA